MKGRHRRTGGNGIAFETRDIGAEGSRKGLVNDARAVGRGGAFAVLMNAIQKCNEELVRILLFIASEVVRNRPHAMKESVRDNWLGGGRMKDARKESVHFTAKANLGGDCK